MVQPDRVADDLRREAVSRVGGRVWRHPTSFAHLALPGYCRSTWQCPAR
jgi:hypothetical protein